MLEPSLARALVAAIAADPTALAELRALVGAPLARDFSQLNGERPSGVGRARYLRAWRRGRDAGDAECRADGRARTMTPGAWTRWGGAPGRKPALRVVAKSSVFEELGAA